MQLIRVLRMVRDLVVRIRNAFKEAEIHAAHSIAEHEGADASGIALKRYGDHVQHQAHMLRVALRRVRGPWDGIDSRARLPGISLWIARAIQSYLQRTHHRQVLVDANAIGGADF